MTSDVRLRQLQEQELEDEKLGQLGGQPGKRSLTGQLRGSGDESVDLGYGYLARSTVGGAGGGGDDPFAVHLDAPARVASAGASSGTPLPGELREKFERSLGADLSGVRVHEGAASADAAKAIHARAYATGNDIHFAEGAYDPGSPDGQHLIAHEVAHTVQQRGVVARAQAKLEISAPGDASEREADVAADAMVSGRTASVSPASGGVIARDPEKTRMPANQPGSGLDASMFSVKGGEPVHSGTVTADKVDTKVRLTSPEISFSAEVTMPKPLGDGERIDVGPVQTMLSSQRVGVYREGGKPDGKIVAEQTMNLGEMRDATGEIGKDGKLDQATMPPFYSAPTAFNSSTSSANIAFKDKPKAVFPSTVGKGKLTETRGQDSFVTSVTAKKDSALLHLKTFKWQLPWALKLDDGVIQAGADGKTSAQEIHSQKAKPEEGVAHSGGDIPILAAGAANHMDFQSLDDAMACSAADLLRFLPTAVAPSRGFIVDAIKAKNPMLHITVTVAKKNSSWGKDSVEVRIKGTTQVTRPRVSAGDGEPVAVMARLLEVFPDPNVMNGDSFVRIEAQDRSLIDGKTHNADWPFPFGALDGPMHGNDGQYTIVANLR